MLIQEFECIILETRQSCTSFDGLAFVCLVLLVSATNSHEEFDVSAKLTR